MERRAVKVPGWLARGLRRVAGPDPEILSKLLTVQAALAMTREKLTNEIERRYALSDKCHERQVEIDRLQAKLVRLKNIEPGPADGCTKIRLRDEAEAWEFARGLSEDTGRALKHFRVYGCDICPRQPVGVSRFLHITSDQSDGARKIAQARNGRRRKDSGTAIGDRLDPEVLARLKGI